MEIQVRKVSERRGDTSRYAITWLGKTISMWTYRARMVLMGLGGISLEEATAQLDLADLQFDADQGHCDWV